MFDETARKQCRFAQVLAGQSTSGGRICGTAKKVLSGRSKRFFQIFLPSFFKVIMISLAVFHPLASLSASFESETSRKLAEEYTEEEKKRYTVELLALGDELFENKNYEYAMAAYEQVFLFDPDNVKASAKLDQLKKQMGREKRDETGIVKEVYDEEARERARTFWNQAMDYLKQEKYAQARFTLEKILLLDPENQEAQKLYEDLKKKHFGKNE